MQNNGFEVKDLFIHQFYKSFLILVKLIADSGATKAEWCLLNNGKKKTVFTQGISPYFLNQQQITEILKKELLPQIKNRKIEEGY